MDYNNLDNIYKYLISEEYDKLDKYSETEIKTVINLRFGDDLKNEYIQKYDIVKRRDKPGYFRKIIKERDVYCILSGKDSSLCDAAHILDYSIAENDEKYDIFNGILLSCDLHRAFDSNFFTFDPDTCTLKILDIFIGDKDLDRLGIKE